jgi:hypothetical protein
MGREGDVLEARNFPRGGTEEETTGVDLEEDDFLREEGALVEAEGTASRAMVMLLLWVVERWSCCGS